MAKNIPFYNSELDLVKALQKGEEKAYKVFYEIYSGLFLSICLRYVGELMTAEDLMVESVMKIFDKVGQFNFQGSFEGWAKRLVVNESLMYIRKNKMIEVSVEDKYVGSLTTEEFTGLEAEELMELVKELPTGYRTVFNLYAIEGYSHAEIAQSLGINEGTSKSQLSRARVMLQDKLKKMNSFIMK